MCIHEFKEKLDSGKYRSEDANGTNIMKNTKALKAEALERTTKVKAKLQESVDKTIRAIDEFYNKFLERLEGGSVPLNYTFVYNHDQRTRDINENIKGAMKAYHYLIEQERVLPELAE